MSAVDKIVGPITYVLKNQKKTILVALISAVVFAVVFFPYDDLSDMITELISKNTQNQVFVQFDHLGVGFAPPSIKMENVEVDARVLPSTLKAGALRISPSIAGLLAFSPGFSAAIDDVMNGQVAMTYRAGKKVNDSLQMQKVVIDLSKINLKDLSKFMSLPVDLEGRVFASLNSQVDPQFVEQPDGALELKIENFNLPSSTIPTMLGPLSISSVKLSNVIVKGQIRNSELIIDDGVIGAPGETLNGRFKGRFGLKLTRQGQQVVPVWSSYEIKVDLSLDKTAEKNFGPLLSFYDKYKSLTGTGSRYTLKLSAPNFRSPPIDAAMGTF